MREKANGCLKETWGAPPWQKEDSSEQQVFGDPLWGKLGNANLIQQIWQSTQEEIVGFVGTAEQSDSP